MEAKTQNFITIGSFVVAFCGLGFSLFTRSQDQNAEFYEKEQEYRVKTSKEIQNIKEDLQNALQSHKNDFQDYKLKTQEHNFKKEKKIENLEMKADHLKNQFEHLHSQTKADNQVLKNELKSWSEKQFKKKND